MSAPDQAHDELFAVMIVVVTLILLAFCVADCARDLEAAQVEAARVEVAP